MNRIIFLLTLLLATPAMGQAERTVDNRAQDQDAKLCVNDGGVTKCLTVDGPTAEVNAPNYLTVGSGALGMSGMSDGRLGIKGANPLLRLEHTADSLNSWNLQNLNDDLRFVDNTRQAAIFSGTGKNAGIYANYNADVALAIAADGQDSHINIGNSIGLGASGTYDIPIATNGSALVFGSDNGTGGNGVMWVGYNGFMATLATSNSAYVSATNSGARCYYSYVAPGIVRITRYSGGSGTCSYAIIRFK